MIQRRDAFDALEKQQRKVNFNYKVVLRFTLNLEFERRA